MSGRAQLDFRPFYRVTEHMKMSLYTNVYVTIARRAAQAAADDREMPDDALVPSRHRTFSAVSLRIAYNIKANRFYLDSL